MNWESEEDMAKDVEENEELYQAFSDYNIYSWKAWIECPECEKNDEVTISIRPSSVGLWCDRCDINSFYE